MNLLYVCENNLFRSPVAEVVTKKIVREEKINTIKVDSAGLDPYERSRSSYFFEALKKLNYDWKFVKNKKPKGVTEGLLKEQDLVLCMNIDQKEKLKEMKEDIYTLPEYAGFPKKEILDPLLFFLGKGIAVGEFTCYVDERGNVYPLKVLTDEKEMVEIWIEFIKEIEDYVNLAVKRMKREFNL